MGTGKSHCEKLIWATKILTLLLLIVKYSATELYPSHWNTQRSELFDEKPPHESANSVLNKRGVILEEAFHYTKKYEELKFTKEQEQQFCSDKSQSSATPPPQKKKKKN